MGAAGPADRKRDATGGAVTPQFSPAELTVDTGRQQKKLQQEQQQKQRQQKQQQQRQQKQQDRPEAEQAGDAQSSVHVELRVRRNPSYCVRDVEVETHERLQRLQDQGSIESCSVHLWETIEIAPGERRAEATADPREKITEFENWADEHDRTLRPGFQTREVNSILTDDTRTKIVPPILCLAVYEGDSLEAVFPHIEGDRIHTVSDGLERLEAGAEDYLPRIEQT